MTVREFTCPNCGAPIDYDGSDTPTVRCSFCNTSVIVPADLRPRPIPKPVDVVEVSEPQAPRIVINTRVQPITPAGRNLLVGIFIFILLIGVASVIVPLLLVGQATRAVSEVIQPMIQEATQAPESNGPAQPTRAPTMAPQPTVTPTPAFAQLMTAFGESGIGPGMLNDARYLAIDGTGNVYAADYQDGRIQVFDPEGKYLHGWQVGDENTIIYGMAASQEGTLFVAYEGNIYRYEGASGKLLGQIPYPRGPEFGDLAANTNGGLLAMWYEGRWGMITSLVGHREDLVWFDAEGNTLQVQEGLLSSQTEELALDVLLAVDGVGNIYATNRGEIYKYASDGRFIDRFSAIDDVSGDRLSVNSIAVDGRGRVYIGGSRAIAIFSPDGRLLKLFDTGIFVRNLAFGPNGDLYVLSGDQVARYSLGVLP